MERKPQPHEWEATTPTRVYLDDIRFLTRLLGQIGENVTIDTEQKKGLATEDNINNLRRNNISQLTFTADKGGVPLVKVYLNTRSAGVWMADISLELSGFLRQVQKILWRDARNAESSVTFLSSLLLLGLLGFGIVGLAQGQAQAAGFLIGSLAPLYIIVWRIRRPFSLIRIWDRPPPGPGFIERNRDGVLLAMLSAVLGALLGSLVTAVFF